MIPINEALATILANTKRLERIEVELLDAFESVLAEVIVSDIDIPPFHKSAMDGYAVRSSDLSSIPGTLKIMDNIAAGSSLKKKIKSGECMKIMTGAPVPPGADSVVMIEDTESMTDGTMKVMKPVVPGQNICVKGEDVKKGKVVLKKGTLIMGPEVAILASVGGVSVSVYRKPDVGIVSTGDEIVEPDNPQEEDNPLEEGKIRNSNGPMLSALVNEIGCRAQYLGIAKDSEEELLRVITSGLKWDMLLLSGGVSMGDYDLIPDVLKKLGATIFFHKVSVKPGKPLLFAKKGRCLIFGIPGNPVSSFTTFHMFIKPAIYKMIGIANYRLPMQDAIIETDFSNRSKRVLIIPSYCTVRNGSLFVTPLELNGSADIIGCSGGNCFMVIDKGVTGIKRGEEVKVFLLKE